MSFFSRTTDHHHVWDVETADEESTILPGHSTKWLKFAAVAFLVLKIKFTATGDKVSVVPPTPLVPPAPVRTTSATSAWTTTTSELENGGGPYIITKDEHNEDEEFKVENSPTTVSMTMTTLDLDVLDTYDVSSEIPAVHYADKEEEEARDGADLFAPSYATEAILNIWICLILLSAVFGVVSVRSRVVLKAERPSNKLHRISCLPLQRTGYRRRSTATSCANKNNKYHSCFHFDPRIYGQFTISDLHLLLGKNGFGCSSGFLSKNKDELIALVCKEYAAVLDSMNMKDLQNYVHSKKLGFAYDKTIMGDKFLMIQSALEAGL